MGLGEHPVLDCSSSCKCWRRPKATREGQGLPEVNHPVPGITWTRQLLLPRDSLAVWLWVSYSDFQGLHFLIWENRSSNSTCLTYGDRTCSPGPGTSSPPTTRSLGLLQERKREDALTALKSDMEFFRTVGANEEWQHGSTSRLPQATGCSSAVPHGKEGSCSGSKPSNSASFATIHYQRVTLRHREQVVKPYVPSHVSEIFTEQIRKMLKAQTSYWGGHFYWVSICTRNPHFSARVLEYKLPKLFFESQLPFYRGAGGVPNSCAVCHPSVPLLTRRGAPGRDSSSSHTEQSLQALSSRCMHPSQVGHKYCGPYSEKQWLLKNLHSSLQDSYLFDLVWWKLLYIL